MKSRLPDGSTMESSHIATIQLPVISNKVRQIYIFPKMKTAPLILLGVLCDDGCTMTLDKQDTSVHKNGHEIMKGTKNRETVMWEVPLETQQSEAEPKKDS